MDDVAVAFKIAVGEVEARHIHARKEHFFNHHLGF